MPDNLELSKWSVPLFEVERPRESPKSAAPIPTKKGTFIAHPRYSSWLARCGVTSSQTALALTGEVLGGHADRNVSRVELHSGVSPRFAYLKREHTVGIRTRLQNKLAGFCWVSRSEREAKILARLEDAGLPGPHWLAYGEDDTGRAFLLIEELTGAVELRQFLNEFTPCQSDRRLLAERLGRLLAEYHGAGFATPDLAAKHLFVHPDSLALTLIDWQSASIGTPARHDVQRWLGRLEATLPSELASATERLRFLWAYRRTSKRIQKSPPVHPFRTEVVAVRYFAKLLARKSSVKLQGRDTAQRLVWLAGEEAVAIPAIAGEWPTPANGEPFYRPDSKLKEAREWCTWSGNRRAVLVRKKSFDPLGRLIAALRERPWRSPSATAARILFHLERHGIPAPRLLAFGQKLISKTESESFLLAEPPANSQPLNTALSDSTLTRFERSELLRNCGKLLRQLHDCGMKLNANSNPNDSLFLVDSSGSVSIGSPFAVKLRKRLGESDRVEDLKMMLSGWNRTDRFRVLNGYETDRAVRRKRMRRGF